MNPDLTKVLGGISPIDPKFVDLMKRQGVLDAVEVVAIHGFPLDWNHWQINEWLRKIDEIRGVTELPIWISESRRLDFRCRGSAGIRIAPQRRTAHRARSEDSLVLAYDLPKAWPATTRHREAEGSAYYRHFYMGLLQEDGTPKRAMKDFSEYTPDLGICQWFHFEDHRLDEAVEWLRKLGVTYIRTGLSWADSFRPNADAWFDRQIKALEGFDVTLTFCFTPEHRGHRQHHTSPPLVPEEYADFCARMVKRYAPCPALLPT